MSRAEHLAGELGNVARFLEQMAGAAGLTPDVVEVLKAAAQTTTTACGELTRLDRLVADQTAAAFAELDIGATDLPYAEPDDAPPRPTFALDGRDVTIVDHIDARALVAEPNGLPLPVLLLTFHVSGLTVDGRPTVQQVAELAFVGTIDSMRKLGKLVRDASNGAANRAELLGGRAN